jgi:hypothetical protein
VNGTGRRTTITQSRICPTCYATIPPDAPPGVCPFCALRAGLRWDDATRPDRGWGPGLPLSVEELGRRLPELEGFELIGPGGMGTVYKARHRERERAVAVKVLHPHLQQNDSSFAARFLREAKTLARLDHPHIVRVYDVGHRDESYYFVMEYVDGVTLRQAMDANRFTPPRPWRWFRGFAKRCSTPTTTVSYTEISNLRTFSWTGLAHRSSQISASPC